MKQSNNYNYVGDFFVLIWGVTMSGNTQKLMALHLEIIHGSVQGTTGMQWIKPESAICNYIPYPLYYLSSTKTTMMTTEH